jgi:hypothetical protein
MTCIGFCLCKASERFSAAGVRGDRKLASQNFCQALSLAPSAANFPAMPEVVLALQSRLVVLALAFAVQFQAG